MNISFIKFLSDFGNQNFFLGHNDDAKILKGLKKINVFIGENNSGKSRFMRLLFSKFYSLRASQKDIDIDIVNYIYIEAFLNRELDEKRRESPNSDTAYYEKILAEIKNGMSPDYQTSFEKTNAIKTNRSGIANMATNYMPENNQKDMVRSILPISIEKAISRAEYDSCQFSITYIPTIRNIRSIEKKLSGNNYKYENTITKSRTYTDYYLKLGSEILGQNNSPNDVKTDFIFTGENIYQNIKDLLLSHHEHRTLLNEFEEFLSNSFFNGKRVSLMPLHETTQEIQNNQNDTRSNADLFIKIGEETERPIQELGDGINYLIIMTFPLFMHKNIRHFVFIEEPELHLHPGLQRVFMQCLNERFTNAQIFLTTHSNHLLDMTLEMSDSMSVYTFKKRQKEDSTQTETVISNVSSSDKNILDLIGVLNSSVFLANCTIWVEGISDVIYIRKYLEVYMEKLGKKKFLEGIHFAFIEYGGVNLIHWSFLDNKEELDKKINPDFITNKRFLICDKDDTDKNQESAKACRYNELRATLNLTDEIEKFYLTEGIEIENMIPASALNDTLKGLYSSPSVASNESEYKNEKLGEFIFKKVNHGSGIRHWNAKGELINKADFALKVKGHVKDLKENEEAFKLCKTLYSFIEKYN